MPTASMLQRILHPLTVDEFVSTYFQLRPLRLPGCRDKFDFLFRERDFPLNLDRVKHIRAFFPRNRQARIQPLDIEDMFNAGATICVTGMERGHSRLRDAARLIRSELNYSGEVSFRAYLSPPRSGFDLHFDARVATTLQIAGAKRWWFSDAPAVRFPTHNSGQGPAGIPRFKAPPLNKLRSVLLRPGDLLCLPAGVWHCAKGETMSLALNLAFDHNGGSVLDAIVNMLQQRLVQDPKWREPLLASPGRSSRRMPESIAATLRSGIDAMQAELSAMRDDEFQLRRTWKLAARSRRTI